MFGAWLPNKALSQLVLPSASVLVLDLSPRPAVVVEGMLGPSLHAEQTRRLAGGVLELSVQHRDVPVSGGLKFALTDPDLAVSAHAVALIGVSRRRTTLVGLRRTSFPPSAVAYEDTLVDLVPAFGAGMDVVMRVRHNVAFVPSLRAHFIGGGRHAEQSATDARRGLGAVLCGAGCCGWFLSNARSRIRRPGCSSPRSCDA